MTKFENSTIHDFNIGKKVYYSILFISLIWLLLIFLAPLLITPEGFSNNISLFIYGFFSKVCHQDDSRSYHIFGNKLAVCSRCIFIYISFFLATALYPLKNNLNNITLPPVIFLIVASVSILLDIILDLTGIFTNTFFTRSVTGFIIGFTLPFYIIPGFVKFFFEVHSFLRNKISA